MLYVVCQWWKKDWNFGEMEFDWCVVGVEQFR